MKYLALLLILLCPACAMRQPVKPVIAAVGHPKTTLSNKEITKVRTSETVKAYPIGRYTDPNFPDEMHERHTLYRREQASDWNYQPAEPYALPLGPTVADSDPSPSYYLQADSEQTNAQQKAYAESLAEQNRAMKKRLDALREEESTLHDLKSELQQLKEKAESAPSPTSSPAVDSPKPEGPLPPKPALGPVPESGPLPEGFSSYQNPLFDQTPLPVADYGFTDPLDLVLFPQNPADYQSFLFSQMRLNDELAKELAAAEWRKLQAWLMPGFLSLNRPP